MSNEIEIRGSFPADSKALEELYAAAFPDEDLVTLLRELLDEEDCVLSLVAISEETLVGHVIFTMCGIAGRGEKLSLLGPVAVNPNVQRVGIGSTLIKEGLVRLKSEGVAQVQVLGDPAYYGRFGFEPDYKVAPPYQLPQEWAAAWQSVSLLGAKPDLGGMLEVPKPWRQPALWAP